MDYRYLKAFQAAARHLNFTRAAAELRISVSALSRQIALLEASTGGDLFIRSTRSVVLTPLGKKLSVSSDRFEMELTSMSRESALRIGCLQSVFEFFLVEVMQKHPERFEGPLDITIGTPASLQVKTAAGELDLVFTSHKPSKSAALSGFRLFQETLSWIGPTDSGRKLGRPIIFSAFENAYPQELREASDRIQVNSFNATLEMTKRGMGRALVALPQGKASEVADLPEKQWIYAIMPNYRNPPDRLKQLLLAVKSEARRF